MVEAQNTPGYTLKLNVSLKKLRNNKKYAAFKSFRAKVEYMASPRVKMTVSNSLEVTFVVPAQYLLHNKDTLYNLLCQRLNKYMGLKAPLRRDIKWPQYRRMRKAVQYETQASKKIHWADEENEDFTDEEWDKINDALTAIVRRNAGLIETINTTEIVPRKSMPLTAYALCGVDPHLRVIFLDRNIINIEDAPKDFLAGVLFHEIICINSWSTQKPFVKDAVVSRAMNDWKGGAGIINWIKERGWRFEFADCKVVVEEDGRKCVTNA